MTAYEKYVEQRDSDGNEPVQAAIQGGLIDPTKPIWGRKEQWTFYEFDTSDSQKSQELEMLHQLAGGNSPIKRASNELRDVQKFLSSAKTTDPKTNNRMSWKEAFPGMMQNLEKIIDYLGQLQTSLALASREPGEYGNQKSTPMGRDNF